MLLEASPRSGALLFKINYMTINEAVRDICSVPVSKSRTKQIVSDLLEERHIKELLESPTEFLKQAKFNMMEIMELREVLLKKYPVEKEHGIHCMTCGEFKLTGVCVGCRNRYKDKAVAKLKEDILGVIRKTLEEYKAIKLPVDSEDSDRLKLAVFALEEVIGEVEKK